MAARRLTLLEITVVIALIAMIAGVASWSLGDLLHTHRLQKAAADVYNTLYELQIEALALGSDIDIRIYEDKGTWKMSSKSAEKILRNQTVELKGIKTSPLELQLLSSGRFIPPKKIVLESSTKKMTIDLSEPILIKKE
jgi:Tfp pilus assembly protein FimT